MNSLLATPPPSACVPNSIATRVNAALGKLVDTSARHRRVGVGVEGRYRELLLIWRIYAPHHATDAGFRQRRLLCPAHLFRCHHRTRRQVRGAERHTEGTCRPHRCHSVSALYASSLPTWQRRTPTSTRAKRTAIYRKSSKKRDVVSRRTVWAGRRLRKRRRRRRQSWRSKARHQERGQDPSTWRFCFTCATNIKIHTGA